MLPGVAPRVNERSKQATEIAQKIWMRCGRGGGRSIYLTRRAGPEEAQKCGVRNVFMSPGALLPARKHGTPGKSAAHRLHQHEAAFLDAVLLEGLVQGERDRGGG